MHVDSTFFGTTMSLGHVDFFVNGGNGINQEPDCLPFAIAGLGCKYSFSLNSDKSSWCRDITQDHLIKENIVLGKVFLFSLWRW